MNCRHCGAACSLQLVDLGSAPPSNAYLTSATLHAPEKWFPLRVLVCETCWLVQTEDFAQAHELFDADYAYFSSFSGTWLDHAARYVEAMVDRFALTSESHVVEVAANDGYLLRHVVDRRIPCTGIEPTARTAAAARELGIPIVEDFFGRRLASDLVSQGIRADLTAANNVLAHVPDINDFVSGFALLLKPDGVATFEFPHVVNLVRETQFDTIYHEHFSYLSLTAVDRIFDRNGLHVFDVEELTTHGGSLRVYAQPKSSAARPREKSVDELLATERSAGVATAAFYTAFQARTDAVKNAFLQFLLSAKAAGKSVAAYGAAAKGNTLLNYAGVRGDLVSYVVDRNPEKQNKYLPGSRIPIVSEDRFKAEPVDYVVILPWNLRAEVIAQLDYLDNVQFVTAVPHLEIV